MKKANIGLLITISVFAIAALDGCMSSRVFQTSGTPQPAGIISDVQVIVPKGTFDQATEVWYQENTMSGAIRSALIEELKDYKKLGPSELTIEFTVTGFYLRSFAQIFWFGVMAGSDSLVGNIAVKKGDTVLKTFDVSAKGSDSAWSGTVLLRLSAGGRADTLCSMIAEKIAREL